MIEINTPLSIGHKTKEEISEWIKDNPDLYNFIKPIYDIVIPVNNENSLLSEEQWKAAVKVDSCNYMELNEDNEWCFKLLTEEEKVNFMNGDTRHIIYKEDNKS